VNWWNELLSPEGKELTLKIVKSLKELSQTVDVFPDPDQLFILFRYYELSDSLIEFK